MKEMKEIWKRYKKYEFSNLGRVRNYRTKNELQCSTNTNGYKALVYYPNGKLNKAKSINVHRTIACLFIPNPKNKPFVNHIDGNKINNCVENLEWCTAKENSQHAIRVGLTCNYGEKNGMAKLSNIEREEIRNSYIKGDKIFGARSLAKKYNVTHQCILLVVKN